MIWYTLPIEKGISWEGHMAGLITGLVFALFFRREIAKPKKYVWEQENFNEEDDPFLKHFDENGNFIESVEPEIEEEQFNITYHFKKEENKD